MLIRRAEDNDMEALLSMSLEFEREACCNGVRANQPSDLEGMDVFVAEESGFLTGYAYGRAITDDKRCVWCEEGKYYELEEVYVRPAWRSQGTGQQLFEQICKEARGQGLHALCLYAVGKDWQRLFRFYIDRLGMTFWSAAMHMTL